MFEIGTTLREARERRNLGLDRAEAETKIRARYLRALEDEDFDVVPGPTYVRGFLRTYAAHLGLDGQLFVDEYNSRFFAPSDDDPFLRRRAAARARRGQRRESHAILVALAAIVAVAVLVVVAATYPRGEHRQTTTGTTNPATTPVQAINPALAGSTASAEPTVSGPLVSLVVVADSACDITVYQGRGTRGHVLFSGTLDPLTGNDRWVARKPSKSGFTVVIGAPGRVHFVIDKRTEFPPKTSTALFVSPADGHITSLAQ